MRFLLKWMCKRNKTGLKYVAEAFNERFEDLLNVVIRSYETHKEACGRLGQPRWREILFIEKAESGFAEDDRKLLPVDCGVVDEWEFDHMMSTQFEPKDRIHFDDIFA